MDLDEPPTTVRRGGRGRNEKGLCCAGKGKAKFRSTIVERQHGRHPETQILKNQPAHVQIGLRITKADFGLWRRNGQPVKESVVLIASLTQFGNRTEELENAS